MNILIVAIVALLSLGGAYYVGRQDGEALCKGAESLAREVSAAAAASSADSAASAISSLELKHVTIRQRAETVIREVPVYRDCVHDARVLRDINEARTGRGTVAAGDRVVPAASAAR